MKKLLFLGVWLILPMASIGQTSHYLLSQLQAAQQDTTRLRLCYDLSDLYYRKHQYDSMYRLIQKGLHLASPSAFPFLRGKLYHQLGLYYRVQGNLNKGMDCLQTALHLYRQAANQNGLPLLLYHIQATYMDQGDFKLALKQGLSNQDYYEKRKLFRFIIANSGQLLAVYQILGDKNLAQVYLRKYAQLAEQSSDVQFQMTAARLKAVDYENDKQFVKAYRYRLLAVKYARMHGLDYFKIYQLRELAANLRQQGLPAQAIPYLQEARQLSDKQGDKPQLALTWQDLALTYLQQDRNVDAFSAIQQAIHTAEHSGYTMEMLRILESATGIQQATGHYREATLTYQKLIPLRDSIYNLEKAKAVSQIQASYDLEKKEHQIVLLQKNAQLLSLKATEHEQQLWLLILGTGTLLGVVGMIGFFLYRANQTRQQLAQQNQLIESQAQELQETNQLKDQLFAVVGHDLRAPIIGLDYIIKQVQQTSPQAQNWPSLLSLLTERVGQLGRLINNLLYWALAQQGLLQDRVERLDVDELLRDCMALLSDIIRHKALQINITGMVEVQVWADERYLQLIVRNLVDNAVKFSPNEGSIDIACSSEAAGLVLVITNQISSQPKGGPNLGLKTVRELVERLNGRLTIEQPQPQIWRVRMDLPVEARTPNEVF